MGRRQCKDAGPEAAPRDAAGDRRLACSSFRTKMMWRALAEHWKLTDALGAHSTCMSDALQIAEIVQDASNEPVFNDSLKSVEEAEDVLGNRARHAAPPGGPRSATWGRAGRSVGIQRRDFGLHIECRRPRLHSHLSSRGSTTELIYPKIDFSSNRRRNT